jgi:hypothetical protein
MDLQEHVGFVNRTVRVIITDVLLLKQRLLMKMSYLGNVNKEILAVFIIVVSQNPALLK